MSDIIKIIGGVQNLAEFAQEHEDDIREIFGENEVSSRGDGSEPTATYTNTEDGVLFIVDTGDTSIQSLSEAEVKQSQDEITISAKGIDFKYDVSDMESISNTDVSVNNGIIQMEVTEE